MKFFENTTEKIVKGIFIGGIIIFVGYILSGLSMISQTTSEIGFLITTSIYCIGTLCKPIGVFVIFKYLCDVLYKLLKLLDNSNNEKYSNE